jgi:hypothetical protein
MSECVKRYIPLDEAFRMRPDALGAQIEADKREGLTSLGRRGLGGVD